MSYVGHEHINGTVHVHLSRVLDEAHLIFSCVNGPYIRGKSQKYHAIYETNWYLFQV